MVLSKIEPEPIPNFGFNSPTPKVKIGFCVSPAIISPDSFAIKVRFASKISRLHCNNLARAESLVNEIDGKSFSQPVYAYTCDEKIMNGIINIALMKLLDFNFITLLFLLIN